MRNLLRKAYTSVFLGVSAFLLFSCSKNITPAGLTKREVTVTDSSSVRVSEIHHGNSIIIDTTSNIFYKKPSPFLAKNTSYQKVERKVKEFYRANALHTKWLFDMAPGNLYYTWLEIIKNATHYGLRAEDYDIQLIKEKVSNLYESDSVSTSDVAKLDIHITEMYFLFTMHLMEGKIRTAGYSNKIWIRKDKEQTAQDVTILKDAYKPEHILSGILQLQPAHDQYVKLQTALEQYRTLEKNTSAVFPTIVVRAKIKPGQSHSVIPVIRRKLSLTDLKVYPITIDSTTGLRDSLKYDETLSQAVQNFQARHGLEPDGIIGEKTLKFLNQSFQEKADIIALNMDRMRWSIRNDNGNYIIINVPEYKLRVYQDQKQDLEMKVIVGAAAKPTPIFNDELSHIVFSPTWTVPVSIIKEEIIPRLKDKPDYYAQKNYSFYKNEVEINPVNEIWNGESVNPYQYRIVQKPGPDNSLGLIKFVMANTMSVYMHDTPNHKLFSKDYRALSHGCVRLDEPARFAEYLLRDQKGWVMEKIRKAMNEPDPAAIQLKKHYKVYIEYRTAWVDDNGQINFREDIYGHDKMQLQQLYTTEKVSTSLAGI